MYVTSKLYFLVGLLLLDYNCFPEGAKGPLTCLPMRRKGEQEASLGSRGRQGGFAS